MVKQSKSGQKLTNEELQEFKDVYQGYQKAIYDLGALDLELSKVKKRLDELNVEKIDLISHIDVLDEQQVSIANKLGDKYGMKQVDLETGELK
jgi:hypothetical protein